MTWIVKGNGSKDALGLTLDVTGSGAAYIGSVQPGGHVDLLNQSEPPEMQIRQGYYIVIVRALGDLVDGSTSQCGVNSEILDTQNPSHHDESATVWDSRGSLWPNRRLSMRSGEASIGSNISTKVSTPSTTTSEYSSDSAFEGDRATEWVAGRPECDGRQLLRMVRHSRVLQLEVLKPIFWAVTLERQVEAESWGLAVKFDKEDKQGSGLVVEAVIRGAAKRWNKARPKEAIDSDDRILSVNTEVGKPSAMMAEMQSAQRLVLVMSRPSVMPSDRRIWFREPGSWIDDMGPDMGLVP